jgi:aminoglycoside phosphotransferase (APT) family kinase protein
VPSPIQRDPEKTSATIAEWLGRIFPGAHDITITKLHAPPSSGFSGETILVDAEWSENGTREAHPLAIRVEPTTYDVFLEPDLGVQYKVMKALADHTDVPMPPMLGFESDRALLGGQFFLMGRVDGEAAPDSPAYTEEGWIKDATPEQQGKLYDSGLRAMAGVHNSDWRKLGLESIARDEFDYVERYYVWAQEPGSENPTMDAAMAWMRANLPSPTDDPALCWGDSRPGNQLYRDFEVVAVLDWEMVTIGDPIMDLGWWLFLQRFHTEGTGVPLLPGFFEEPRAVARWEELTGRQVDPDVLHFYIGFAGIRFGCVMMRLATLMSEFGILPVESNMARNNPVLAVLANHLGLPAPS